MAEYGFFSERITDLFYNPATGEITRLHIAADLFIGLVPIVLVAALYWLIHKKMDAGK